MVSEDRHFGKVIFLAIAEIMCCWHVSDKLCKALQLCQLARITKGNWLMAEIGRTVLH
jgi:hypothetical protein